MRAEEPRCDRRAAQAADTLKVVLATCFTEAA